jgi:alkylhydroperoxidase family enzyme
MPRIAVPNGPESITDRVWQLRPDLDPAWRAMKKAVNHLVDLPIEILEVVRYRIGQLNGCLLCQTGRDPRALAAGFTEATYGEVENWAASAIFTDSQRMALEYTERFTLDWLNIDDAFFERLREIYTDEQILDLTFYIGRYLAFGRLAHVLGLDDSCTLATAT